MIRTHAVKRKICNILLHVVCTGRKTRRFRPFGYSPTRRGRCFKLYYKYRNSHLIHMYFTLSIYRLNVMFRHMPVPRDTSVLREIIFVCCESVGNCQTLPKEGPSQLVNNVIFRPCFLFFASDGPRFLPLLSRSDVRPPRVLYIVYQQTALYIT